MDVLWAAITGFGEAAVTSCDHSWRPGIPLFKFCTIMFTKCSSSPHGPSKQDSSLEYAVSVLSDRSCQQKMSCSSKSWLRWHSFFAGNENYHIIAPWCNRWELPKNDGRVFFRPKQDITADRTDQEIWVNHIQFWLWFYNNYCTSICDLCTGTA